MAGVTAPSSGEVYVGGRVSPLIELGAGFHPDLTGRENVHLNASILGMSDREVNEQFDAIVAFAELEEFIDTPVKRYSSGMYMRLGFSVAVHSQPDALLVDEVLSVGDAFFQEKCLAKMNEFQANGVTIVVVSHDPGLVERFCDRAYWLEHGRLMAEGPARSVVQEYLEALHVAEAV
jgi:ABC-type polysaccharide/polyol phosphate transport system ATPase subunit